MEDLIKNVKIVSIDYKEYSKEFFLVYSFNVGDDETREQFYCFSDHRKHISVKDILEELKKDAYNSLTLKDIAPYYKVAQ